MSQKSTEALQDHKTQIRDSNKDKTLGESKENVQITRRKEADTHSSLRRDHTGLEYLMPMATTEDKPGQRPISIPTTRTCSLK